MAATVASAGVPYVAMHWRAPSHEMNGHAVYRDVVADMVAELPRRVQEVVPGAMLGAAGADGADARPLASRDTASAAAAEAWCVRVHDGAASLDAVRVAEAWGEGAAHANPGGVPGP